MHRSTSPLRKAWSSSSLFVLLATPLLAAPLGHARRELGPADREAAGNGIRLCSPVYIAPLEYPDYLGLYRKPGATPAPSGCGSPTCTITPTIPPGCGDVPCRTYSDAAFRDLNGLIDSSLVPEDKSSGNQAWYRFAHPSGNPVIDVRWRRTLFDGAAATSNQVVTAPPGFDENDGSVFDVLGDPASFTLGSGSITLTSLGQPPRVVVWQTGP